jgi:hypothetical protein
MQYTIQKTRFLPTTNILEFELTHSAMVKQLYSKENKQYPGTLTSLTTRYRQELFNCSNKFPAPAEPYRFITIIP